MPYQKILTVIIFITIAMVLSGFGVVNQVSDSNKPLTTHQWQNRLLLLNVGSRQQLIPIIEALEQQAINERKLLIYVLIEQQNYQLLPAGQLKLAQAFELDVKAKLPDINSVMLIGLDGTVKAQYAFNQFSLDKVIRLIDSMPMRQAELMRENS